MRDVRHATCERRSAYLAFRLLPFALFLSLLSSCAPKSLTLPTGAPTPLADPAPLLAALRHCDADGSLTAEIGLSGRAAGQRLRGTLHAGFAPPDALRLEGIAPFGAPIFLLAGQGGTATLLLPRENRIVRDAPAGAILEGLAGLDVTPGDLRAWLAGCPATTPRPRDPGRYGDEWIAAALDGGRRIWVRRAAGTAGGGWRLTAVSAGDLQIEFADHVGAQPGRLRITRAASAAAAALDIRLAVRQVERGAELAPAAFVLDVPADAIAITLDELRAAGPLRDTGPPR